MTFWDKAPRDLISKATAYRWGRDMPAPDLVGFLVYGSLIRDGGSVSRRELGDICGWTEHHARRVIERHRLFTSLQTGIHPHTRPTDVGATGNTAELNTGNRPVPDRKSPITGAKKKSKSQTKRKKRTPTGEVGSAYSQAIALWTELHDSLFGQDYPWLFKGRNHDGSKIKVWLAAVKLDRKTLTDAETSAGIAALRSGITAYMSAVKAGTAWPADEPATTARFTDNIAKWLRTDPAKATHQPGSMAANLQAMWDDMPAQGKL